MRGKRFLLIGLACLLGAGPATQPSTTQPSVDDLQLEIVQLHGEISKLRSEKIKVEMELSKLKQKMATTAQPTKPVPLTAAKGMTIADLSLIAKNNDGDLKKVSTDEQGENWRLAYVDNNSLFHEVLLRMVNGSVLHFTDETSPGIRGIPKPR